MTDLHFQSATQLAQRIRDRQTSARDLLEHFLARVDRLNPALNAVVVLSLIHISEPTRPY